MITVMYDEGSRYLGYKNSTEVFNESTSDTEGDDSNDAYIGDGTGSANGRNIGAIIDEVRISNINRAADWVTTEYNSMTNTTTFINIGSEQYQ